MKTYDVTINRIGYASRQIEVKANSQKEAEEKALDEAGSIEFSEHDADYVVEGRKQVKTFPNGFESWYETHHEVVAHLATTCDSSGTMANVKAKNFGTGGLYELGEELTNEFEKKYEGKEWDGEFFDAIEDFLTAKEDEHFKALHWH